MVAVLKRKRRSTYELIDAVRERLSSRVREELILEILASARGFSFDRAENGDWIALPAKRPIDILRDLKDCELLYRKGKYTQAAQRANAIVAADATQLNATILLGECQLRLGNYKKSADAFGAALRLSPNNISALEALALCLERLGKTNKACGVLARLVSLRPNNRLVWRDLLRLLYQTGNYRELTGCFRNAPSSVKKDLGCVLFLAMSLDRLGDIEQALTLYRIIAKREPKNQIARHAILYLEQARLKSTEAAAARSPSTLRTASV